MSIDFGPYGSLRRTLASDGVDIAAKFVKRRSAPAPAAVRSHTATHNRIASVRRLAFAFAALGAIAPVALTTTAFGDELRDTMAAGAGRVGVAESIAPKLGPERRRGEAKGVVLSQADIPRDPEEDADDPPATARSITCAEALASEPLQNMDEYLDDIGVRYEAFFDQALSGAHCTGQEVSDFLLDNGAYLQRFHRYNNRNNYYIKYRSGNFLNFSFFIPFHVSIVEGKDGFFQYSRWNMTFL